MGSKDERAALIQNFPTDNSINQHDNGSPGEGFDVTMTTSRSVAFRNSVNMSGSQENRMGGEMTDYQEETDFSETEGESSLSITVTIHEV